MPHPSSAPEIFNTEIYLTIDSKGNYVVSNSLAKLLITYRNEYDWPRGIGAKTSQQEIINIVNACKSDLFPLEQSSLICFVSRISNWGGNNEKARQAILLFNEENKLFAVNQINNLSNNVDVENSLNNLTKLPGIDLVMATKIYRFCSPMGAALDRHSSYFFNSLKVRKDTSLVYSTNFKRQWSNAKHLNSRLANYSASGLAFNLSKYISEYLPILNGITLNLNLSCSLYYCAAEQKLKKWTNADVEMAAYYWWALNGVR